MDLFSNHYYSGNLWELHIGDALECLRALQSHSVQCFCFSPPYWGLRDYFIPGQIGLERTPQEYVDTMVRLFREIRRVLRQDGTVWLNLGDSYSADGKFGGQSGGLHRDASEATYRGVRTAGVPPKNKIGIPPRVALALQDDGWYWRDEIVWSKKSPMPSPVEDRTTSAHEMIYLLTPGPEYFYDQFAVREAGVEVADKNLRSVWTLATEPLGLMLCTACKQVFRLPLFKQLPKDDSEFRARDCVCGAKGPDCWLEHFAPYPSEIPKRAISLGTPVAGVCSKCYAPMFRNVNKQSLKRERPNEYTKHDGSEGTGNAMPNTCAGISWETLGWEFSCDCGAPAQPARVCDPFSGSGTTGMVATELGRYFIGSELNPDYGILSRYRYDSWRNRDLQHAADLPVPGQLILF